MGYTKTQRNSYGGWIEKREEGGYYLIIMGGYTALIGLEIKEGTETLPPP